MVQHIQRYLIPAHGAEVEPIKTAMALVQALCKESETPIDAILFIPSKRSLEGTTLEEVLGTTITKALLKGEIITLPGGGNLKLKTQRTFRDRRTSAIVLAVYATTKMLDEVDNVKDAAAVIIVPWDMEEVADWKRTWNPRVLGEPPTEPSKLIHDPVAEEALKMLTHSINLSTGLLNPTDKNRAVQLFRELRKNRVDFDPRSVRAWAVRKGWTPDGADRLRDVVQAVEDRRPIRGGSTPAWSDDIMDILRKRASGK